MKKYLNRREAGLILAASLSEYQNNKDIIVLALPRGGVPVAYEVAQRSHAPLDIYIVRKLGIPGYQELAMGAITQSGTIIFNQDILNAYHVTQAEIDAVIAKELTELMRREKVYRGNRPFPSLENKIVILVDDGIATGATMKAAILAIRKENPAEMVVAIPVADQSIQAEMSALVDKFICPMIVQSLQAVGLWYEDFSQTEDEEVHLLLPPK